MITLLSQLLPLTHLKGGREQEPTHKVPQTHLCRCYKSLHGLDVLISQNLRNSRNEAPCPLPKTKIKTRELD